jgi:hypothetical protein
VLAVVSNLQVDRSEVVRLRWTGGGRPQVLNARTGQPVAVADDTLSVELPPEAFVLLGVRATS